MYIFDIEIKSCESVANTACESHADSVMYFWLLVLWLKMQPFGLSSTGIWGLLTISFSWLSCGHLILNLCCIHCSDCKVRFLLLNIHVFIKQRVRNYKYHTWWSCLHITDHNHCMHKTVLNTDALNQLFTCSSMSQSMWSALMSVSLVVSVTEIRLITSSGSLDPRQVEVGRCDVQLQGGL